MGREQEKSCFLIWNLNAKWLILEGGNNVNVPNTNVKYHSFPLNFSALSYYLDVAWYLKHAPDMPLCLQHPSYSNFESVTVKLTFYYISGNMLIQSLSFIQQYEGTGTKMHCAVLKTILNGE